MVGDSGNFFKENIINDILFGALSQYFTDPQQVLR